MCHSCVQLLQAGGESEVALFIQQSRNYVYWFPVEDEGNSFSLSVPFRPGLCVCVCLMRFGEQFGEQFGGLGSAPEGGKQSFSDRGLRDAR